jgi:hypothetical protein
MIRPTTVLVALALALAGCSDDSDSDAGTPPSPQPSPAQTSPTAPQPEPSHCPTDLLNCETASGRIIYVERVDADGDGDAHFVLQSRESITAPGLSVIDVKQSLRPTPLPGPGDRLSAAGPVYRGRYGQRQIEAVELHVARRP